MAAYAGDGQARGWFPELMSIPTGGHSVVSERFRHSGFELTHKERVRRIASNDRREEVAPKTLPLRRIINDVLVEGDPAQLLSCQGADHHHGCAAAGAFPTRWRPSISSRNDRGIRAGAKIDQ